MVNFPKKIANYAMCGSCRSRWPPALISTFKEKRVENVLFIKPQAFRDLSYFLDKVIFQKVLHSFNLRERMDLLRKRKIRKGYELPDGTELLTAKNGLLLPFYFLEEW